LFIYKETPLQYFCFVYILTYVLVDDGKLSNIVKLNCVNARKSLQLRIRCKMKKKIKYILYAYEKFPKYMKTYYHTDTNEYTPIYLYVGKPKHVTILIMTQSKMIVQYVLFQI